jgi:hypothetical protein
MSCCIASPFEVRLGTELLGWATLREPAQHVLHRGTPVVLDCPLSQEAIRYVDDHVSGAQVELMLEVRGDVRYRTESGPEILRSEDEGWRAVDVRSGQNYVHVPRSQWLNRVVEPLGMNRYVLMELAIPEPPERGKWEHALAHLDQAEKLYREGNDSEVLGAVLCGLRGPRGCPQGDLRWSGGPGQTRASRRSSADHQRVHAWRPPRQS